MAVVAFTSEQLAPEGLYAKRLYPIEDHGKLRFQYAYFKNLSGAAGDATSTVELVKLPPGRVRLVPHLARLRSSAFGASRVLKIGHRAYSKGSMSDLIAEDDDAFSSALDISAAAAVANSLGTQLKYDLYSVAGITVFATVTGGTIPTDAELEMWFPYVYE